MLFGTDLRPLISRLVVRYAVDLLQTFQAIVLHHVSDTLSKPTPEVLAETNRSVHGGSLDEL